MLFVASGYNNKEMKIYGFSAIKSIVSHKIVVAHVYGSGGSRLCPEKCMFWGSHFNLSMPEFFSFFYYFLIVFPLSILLF